MASFPLSLSLFTLTVGVQYLPGLQPELSLSQSFNAVVRMAAQHSLALASTSAEVAQITLCTSCRFGCLCHSMDGPDGWDARPDDKDEAGRSYAHSRFAVPVRTTSCQIEGPAGGSSAGITWSFRPVHVVTCSLSIHPLPAGQSPSQLSCHPPASACTSTD